MKLYMVVCVVWILFQNLEVVNWGDIVVIVFKRMVGMVVNAVVFVWNSGNGQQRILFDCRLYLLIRVCVCRMKYLWDSMYGLDWLVVLLVKRNVVVVFGWIWMYFFIGNDFLKSLERFFREIWFLEVLLMQIEFWFILLVVWNIG